MNARLGPVGWSPRAPTPASFARGDRLLVRLALQLRLGARDGAARALSTRSPHVAGGSARPLAYGCARLLSTSGGDRAAGSDAALTAAGSWEPPIDSGGSSPSQAEAAGEQQAEGAGEAPKKKRRRRRKKGELQAEEAPAAGPVGEVGRAERAQRAAASFGVKAADPTKRRGRAPKPREEGEAQADGKRRKRRKGRPPRAAAPAAPAAEAAAEGAAEEPAPAPAAAEAAEAAPEAFAEAPAAPAEVPEPWDGSAAAKAAAEAAERRAAARAAAAAEGGGKVGRRRKKKGKAAVEEVVRGVPPGLKKRDADAHAKAKKALFAILSRRPFNMSKDSVESFLKRFDAFPGKFPYVDWHTSRRAGREDPLKEELVTNRADLLLRFMPPARFRDFVVKFPVKFVDCQTEVGSRVKFLTQDCKFLRRDVYGMLSQNKGVESLLKLRRETWEQHVLAPLREHGFNADEIRKLVVGRPELLAVHDATLIPSLVEAARRVMPSLEGILASPEMTDRMFRFTFFRRLFDMDFAANLSGLIQQLMRAGFDQEGAEAFVREFPDILHSKALADLKPKIDYLEKELGVDVKRLGPTMIANHRGAGDKEQRYPNVDYLLFVPRRAW